MTQFPQTVDELLHLLDQLQPEPSPTPDQTLAQINYDAGRRSLVRQVFALRELAVPSALKAKRGQGRVHRQHP